MTTITTKFKADAEKHFGPGIIDKILKDRAARRYPQSPYLVYSIQKTSNQFLKNALDQYAGYVGSLPSCCGVGELHSLSSYRIEKKYVSEIYYAKYPELLEKMLCGALLYAMWALNKGCIKYYCPRTDGTLLGDALRDYGFTKGETFFNRNSGNDVDEYTIHFGKDFIWS